MKVLVIDNYDSFTYNLVHSLRAFSSEIAVWRNDQFALEDVQEFHKILLSPGPGIPSEANLLMPLIRKYASTKSILGVCLGQQAIAEVFGGKLLNTQEVYHGVASEIQVGADEVLFKDLPKKIDVGRYHSWVVSEEGFPSELEITARGPKNEIMALRHQTYDLRGVQFHPESILTPTGDKIIENWMKS